MPCGEKSPGPVVLQKAWGDLAVVCRKGTAIGTATFTSKPNSGVWGNVIAGGLIGYAIDYKVSSPKGVRPYAVKATGTATVSDAFAGVERLRIANERSVMENIKDFINQLATFPD